MENAPKPLILLNLQQNLSLHFSGMQGEQALMLALMEMVIQGVSTRKVSVVTEELCGAEFPKSTVSDLCKRLDPLVETWNASPLRENRYPFVIVDALVIKIREDERIAN